MSINRYKKTTIGRLTLLSLLLTIYPAWCAEPLTLEVVSLKHLTAEQMLPLIKPLLDKQGAVSGMNNQLVLRTTPENLQQIKEVLKRFDIAPQRLLITVKQDVTQTGAEEATGLAGSVRAGKVRASAGGKQTAGDGVEVRVERTSAHDSDLATQQIQVLAGREAFIQIGQSVPLAESKFEIGGADPRSFSSITYQDLTTGFNVLPTISGDFVTLEVSPQRAKPSVQGGGKIDIQQMHTTVSGRLGEWIDLGGNSQDETQASNEVLYSTRSLRNDERRVLIKVEKVEGASPAPVMSNE